jgi:hypothetical protein
VRIGHPSAVTRNASRAWTGHRRERPRTPFQAPHPAAVVVGTESRAVPSSAIPGHASDRRRVHQRQEGTHADAIPGTARGRHHVRQGIATLRRGAAQPAHPARRRTRPEIVPILTVGITGNAIPIAGCGAADAPGVGRAPNTFCGLRNDDRAAQDAAPSYRLGISRLQEHHEVNQSSREA